MSGSTPGWTSSTYTSIKCLPLFVTNRTIARRSSVGGLYVCAGKIDILKFCKTSTELVFHFSHWGDWSFVCGAKPTKAPVAPGLVTNSRLFRKLHYQTMPGRTLLSSDCKVLRSTVIALNNVIQYSHCLIVEPFRLTPFLIKVSYLNVPQIISTHIVYPRFMLMDAGTAAGGQ